MHQCGARYGNRLFYDWDCDGRFGSTTITVNNDGTFTSGEGPNGLWVQIAGMFVFTFNNTEVTYAGNLAGKSITGVNTTFSGRNGCFYMLQEGVPTAFAETRVAAKPDVRGKS